MESLVQRTNMHNSSSDESIVQMALEAIRFSRVGHMGDTTQRGSYIVECYEEAEEVINARHARRRRVPLSEGRITFPQRG